MGEDPAAIREQIEQTRVRMGDTVDALGYKADVPARTKESISHRVEEVRDTVREKFTGATSRVSDATSRVSDAAPDAGDVKQAGRQAVGVVQENPLGLAIGAAAVGFLAGMLVPSTGIEDERLGPVADQVKEQVRQTGQEALERGKQMAQETVEVAADSAKRAATEVRDQAQEAAQQQAEGLRTSAQDSAQEVRDAASSS